MISIVIISKDEASLNETLTDVTAQAASLEQPSEVVVVDASEGRLEAVRCHHRNSVTWIDFRKPEGVDISIPHQRNAGVRSTRGNVVVFTDAGCRPEKDWLKNLLAPIFEGESIAVGLTLSTLGSTNLYDQSVRRTLESSYLHECSTINLAFRKDVYEAVGGFDEGFAYGSDVDWSWRVRDAGFQIRSAPDAVIRHDWGTWRRQLRRSYLYGRARVRLYRKHRSRRRNILKDEPMLVVYPVFLLGLPLTLIFPPYLALLLIPAWRNRSQGPAKVIIDHIAYGVGALAEVISS